MGYGMGVRLLDPFVREHQTLVHLAGDAPVGREVDEDPLPRRKRRFDGAGLVGLGVNPRDALARHNGGNQGQACHADQRGHAEDASHSSLQRSHDITLFECFANLENSHLAFSICQAGHKIRQYFAVVIFVEKNAFVVVQMAGDERRRAPVLKGPLHPFGPSASPGGVRRVVKIDDLML